jgi:hypothetical protein
MKNRARNSAIGIIAATLIFMAAFYFDDSLNNITTYSVYDTEETPEDDGVLVAGIGFTAMRDGNVYHYIFSDEDAWYMSIDEVTWEKAPELGDTMWTGLYYIKYADSSSLYYKGEEIKYVAEFARQWGRIR